MINVTYRRIADRLAELGVRREDVLINLVVGNGIASYAP
jgi:hypothetical protein